MFQMFLQKGAGGLSLGSVQMAQGSAVQQGAALSMQAQVVSAGPLQNNAAQQHAGQPQALLRDQSTALPQVRQAVTNGNSSPTVILSQILCLSLYSLTKVPCLHRSTTR